MTTTDTDLERLLADAAAAVHPPADGPARIIAARDALSAAPAAAGRTPSPRDGRRRVVLAAAAAAVVVVAVAVGALAGRSGSTRTSASTGSTASLPATAAPAIGAPAIGGPAIGAPSAAGGVAAVAGSGSAASSTGTAAGAGGTASGIAAPAGTATGAPAPVVGPVPGSVPGAVTRVVKTGTVALVVGRGGIEATMGRLSSDAAALGGYVASSSSTTATVPPSAVTGKLSPGSGAPVDSSPLPGGGGELTLRVPVAAFDTLVADVRRAGTAVSVTTSGQDVTGQSVDLQARISALGATRTQFQQLLARATSIGDILSVESQLTQVQTELEQLQGQAAVLADQSASATLSVHLSDTPPAVGPVPVGPRSGLAGAWDHARHSFATGADAVVGASGGVAVALLTVAVVLLAARLGWLVVRRRML